MSRAKVATRKSEKPLGFTEYSQGEENSKCGSHSGCQPEEFSPRVQALISGPPGGISLSFEPVENSRSRSHSSCQPDEFLPRSEALIREPTGGSDLSLESAAAGTGSVSDARLLYCTLVNDAALPSGYEAEFEGLMRTVEPAAERHARPMRSSSQRTLRCGCSVSTQRSWSPRRKRSETQTASEQPGPRNREGFERNSKGHCTWGTHRARTRKKKSELDGSTSWHSWLADTNGQAPARRTEQRKSTRCGAKGVNVEVESQAPTPVLFVAGADTRCALSVRALPAHRLPQSLPQ